MVSYVRIEVVASYLYYRSLSLELHREFHQLDKGIADQGDVDPCGDVQQEFTSDEAYGSATEEEH